MDLKQRWGWLAHVFKACTQQHHKELRPVLAPFIPADAVVLDIGAHAGQFAKLFARMAPRGEVFAYEPSPYALSILRKAIAFNRLRNVRIIPKGFSNVRGEAVLHTPIKRHGDMGFGLAHLGSAEGRSTVAHTVELTTIDVACRGFDRLDFVKIDIEGWELSALRGGEKTLKRLKPAILCEVNEQHLARAGTSPRELWAYLEGLGYSATLSGKAAPDYTTAAGDYLWRAAA